MFSGISLPSVTMNLGGECPRRRAVQALARTGKQVLRTARPYWRHVPSLRARCRLGNHWLPIAMLCTGILVSCGPGQLPAAPTKTPLIGYLAPAAPGPSPYYDALIDGLRDEGYVLGRN